MHGKEAHGKQSDYAKQLREKQKARRIFGISEKQIHKYYTAATASPEISGEELIRQMEHRLDNIVFRAGFATTRRQARQFVAHGIFMLNGKRINVPSVQLKTGDIFSVRPNRKSLTVFSDYAKRNPAAPKWIKVDSGALSGEIIGKAEKDDIEGSIMPQMIIEFYSR